MGFLKETRTIGWLVVAAAALGLVFAAYSTYDYAQHLDRQIHAVHCSFIPGAPAGGGDDSACKAALFSPYSAIFRQSFWGGVPISLFAVGAFSFFAAFGAYLLVARDRAPRIAFGFLGIAGLTPLVASMAMFVISAVKLHSFCKLCVGIYVASIILAAGALLALMEYLRLGRASLAAPGTATPAGPQASGTPILAGGWLLALGVAAVLPAIVYVASLPDVRPYLTSCGTVTLKPEPHGALLKIPTAHPTTPVTLFEDPLCPTCKAFHQRLVVDDIFEKLDVTMALFPLDTECNWMIDRSLHPGACLVSGAVLCSEKNARAALEWAYDNQDDLTAAGKAGPEALKAKLAAHFGPDIAACAADKKTGVRINRHLHFASDNHVPISTPQMILGERRICEEDTDLGLKYTLAQLAPAVFQ
jgi:uncharacterized membrane protein